MGIFVVIDNDLKDYKGEMPRELRKAAKGNTMPIVVVTNSDGSKPITGYTANGNNAKSVKQIARDVRKKIRENPGIIAAGATSASDEKKAEETEKEADSNSAYNVIAESQKWTNSAGKDITAAVLAVDVSNVTFLMPNGKQVEYPLSKLSAESQAALSQLVK